MFICLLFTSSISSASNSQGYSIDDLESFIKNIESEQEGVQGGAVAIIINEKIVYKKSFGFKDIGRTLPIDRVLTTFLRKCNIRENSISHKACRALDLRFNQKTFP